VDPTDDEIEKIGEFSEQGRGVPVQASRPGPALPFSPLVRQAYAPAPLARLGWCSGVIRVEEVTFDPPGAVSIDASIIEVARRMFDDESDVVPIVEGNLFRGVVYIEDLLERVAAGDLDGLGAIVSVEVPVCSPRSELVDAVRQMVACYLRRIPVVGDDGTLVGMLSMSTAAQASERDPSVRDLIESCLEPSFFARRWR
jgi:CBS domain-containing protein